ncbi:hypothetical protein MKZ38_007472 [Zalerion maritima]|uniref:Uncharacterized protein n=1 Tax=Zalerion maritima TaxID=339359 RepID=A0AAD5WTL9_9PEZI|nr:hypothetical protein MKZ38_007472 [Zalerion maritima]
MDLLGQEVHVLFLLESSKADLQRTERRGSISRVRMNEAQGGNTKGLPGKDDGDADEWCRDGKEEDPLGEEIWKRGKGERGGVSG